MDCRCLPRILPLLLALHLATAHAAPVVAVLQSEPIILINTTELTDADVTLKQDVTFKIDPRGSKSAKQIFRLDIRSTVKRKLGWDIGPGGLPATQFKESFGFKLPLAIEATPGRILLAFQYDDTVNVWNLIASTAPPTVP